jgi:hypothetical protein
MFARVSRYRGSPDKLDAGLRVAGQTLDDAKDVGYLGSYALVDRQSGNAMTVTIWDSREHLEASAASADPLRQQISDAFGATEPPTVEVYEVAIANTDQLRKAA